MRMGDQVRDLKFGRVEEGDQGRVLWMGFLVNGEPTELKVHRYKNNIKKLATFPVGIVGFKSHSGGMVCSFYMRKSATIYLCGSPSSDMTLLYIDPVLSSTTFLFIL